MAELQGLAVAVVGAFRRTRPKAVQLTARAGELLGQVQFQPGRAGQGGVEICGSGAVARPGRPGRSRR